MRISGTVHTGEWYDIDAGIRDIKCDHCNEPGTDEWPIYYGPDPYALDVNNDDTPVWLHAKCYGLLSDEI